MCLIRYDLLLEHKTSKMCSLKCHNFTKYHIYLSPCVCTLKKLVAESTDLKDAILLCHSVRMELSMKFRMPLKSVLMHSGLHIDHILTSRHIVLSCSTLVSLFVPVSLL